jgi:hypothetical protein
VEKSYSPEGDIADNNLQMSRQKSSQALASGSHFDSSFAQS